MNQLIRSLFSKKWINLQNDLSSLENGEYPGVYLLAYSNEDLEGKSVDLKDVFYVGMSNSHGGVRQRLKRFLYGIENDTSHSAARRFYKEYAESVPFSQMKGRKTFYSVSMSVRCVVNKETRTPDDLRKMGDVAALEYYVLAHIKDNLNREPKLNKK